MALRILLVEDHLASQRAMAKMLSRRGYEVTTANNGAEAMRLAEGCQYDLLICDVGLPDISGWDVLKKTQKACPHIPAIAVTGFGQPADRQRSALSGFKAHLTKPVTIAQIDTAIEQVLGRRLDLQREA
jgi:two-component system, chemotaxis family, CheB/CheR fusion protein